MRSKCIVLSILLLFACSACQPIPDVAVVTEKPLVQMEVAPPLETKTEKSIASQLGLEQRKFTSSEEIEKLIIEFDASISLPEVSRVPVYSAKLLRFSQEHVANFINGVLRMEGAEHASLYRMDMPKTKAELQLELEEVLVHFRAGTMDFDEGMTEEDLIALYTEWIDAAPDQKPENSAISLDSLPDSFSAAVDTGSANAFLITHAGIENLGYTDFLQFQKHGMDPTYYTAEPKEIAISREDALLLAREALRYLELDYMDFNYYEALYLSLPPQAGRYRGHEFVFTRTLDRIPFTFSGLYTIHYREDEPQRELWSYEKSIVRVDDTGVSHILWDGPIAIDALIDEAADLLPFEEMIAQASDTLRSMYPFGNMLAERAAYTRVFIDEIVFGYMLVQSGDTQFTILPVWDFFGYTQFQSTASDEWTRGEKIRYPLLTINAIDGSRINREKGY